MFEDYIVLDVLMILIIIIYFREYHLLNQCSLFWLSVLRQFFFFVYFFILFSCKPNKKKKKKSGREDTDSENSEKHEL